MAAELPELIAENRSRVGAAGQAALDEDVFGPEDDDLDPDVFGPSTGTAPLPLMEIRPTLTTGQRVGRIAVEMGGQMAGEMLGGARGGIFGLMVGGGAGAAAGSLLAESFAPSEDPAHEALVSGMFGLIPVGPLLKWAFAPKVLSEEGQALLDIARKHDAPIPPALASRSRGMQLAQGIARGTAVGGASVDEAIMAFGRALGEEGQDQALRAMGLNQVEIDVFRSISDPSNARAFDPKLASDMLKYGAGYALQGKIELESVFRAADDMGLKIKTDLVKDYVEGLARVYEKGGRELPEGMKSVFAAIRAMDDRVALRDFHKLRSDLLAAGRFESGTVPRAMIDDAKAMAADISEFLTKNGKRGADQVGLGDAWLGASGIWRQHKQGELVKEIADLGLREVGAGDVKAASQRVLNELNKEWVKKTLTPTQQLNLRRYAALLRTYQAGEGTNLYQFATRGGQVAMAAGLIGGSMLPAGEEGGERAVGIGQAVAIALPVFVVPEIMARIFSDPGMSRLFLQGFFKSKTALGGIGALGVLMTRLADEGLVPKETLVEFNESLPGGQRMRGRIRFPEGTAREQYR